jgi:hypothetical protein
MFRAMTDKQIRLLPAVHGAFFAVSGLWPVVSLRSFERVTGYKADGWLAQTTGGLIAAIGATLLVSARGPRSATERVLGLSTAATLLAADVVFALVRRRISRIYLLDAAAEAMLVAGWAALPERFR